MLMYYLELYVLTQESPVRRGEKCGAEPRDRILAKNGTVSHEVWPAVVFGNCKSFPYSNVLHT